jgi:DNA-binding transcriptional LysR family regulator
MLMNLAQLRALTAVADEGSFTAAAGVLGVSQSAVSHTLAALERELALPLVVRHRSGTTLTAHGQQAVGHAREALRRVERIAQDAAAAAGRHRGRLRVAAFPSAAQLLPPLIARFGRNLPDVAVVLLEGSDSEVKTWLDDGVVDLAVIATLRESDGDGSAGLSPQTAGALLAVDPFVAVLDRDHPLADQAAVALADLEDDPFLLSDGGCEPLLRRLYDNAGTGLHPVRRIHDTATLLAMVQQQLGVTVLPELALPRKHDLAVVPVAPAAHRALHLVPADERHVSAAATTFLDLARASRHGQPSPPDFVATPE